MLDVHGHNPSPTRDQRFQGMNGTSLTQWIHRHVGGPQVQVRSKLRGNNLHILLEGKPCPDQATIVPRLMQILSANDIARLLPSESSSVYRVIVYGRLPQQAVPAWTETFVPNQLDRQRDDLRSTSNQSSAAETQAAVKPSNDGSTAMASVLDQARGGQPDAIARYLSGALSHLGIAIRVKLERLQQSSPSTPQGTASLPAASDPLDVAPTSATVTSRRLIIICESAYAPDPLLIAEPIAQHLRILALKGFRDAVVFGQVTGESRSEWTLRVDLTPPDDILKEWARWGDVQAITRLLNHRLLPQHVQVLALLKEATLHLTCRGTQAAPPDKLATIAATVPLLESLAPQGIRAATIYGFATQDQNVDLLSSASTPAPLWVHWLDLLEDQSTAPASALSQAQQGDLDAITFLLTRLLNPDLDRKLATGGIRVQVRQKADLLHIMSEAPTCPRQNQVGPSIARFLKPLQIPAIAGIRIYGRRSGQKQPLWSYGIDFAARNRLVPEAAPEFAVSDAYVGDLLSPPGALALRTEQRSEGSQSLLGQLFDRAVQRVQQSLIWTQLFIPLESDPLTPASPLASPELDAPRSHKGIKIAAVWSAVGILLIVQSDWILGQWMQPAPSSPSAAQPASVPTPFAQAPTEPALPNLTLKKTKPGEKSIFSASGFTQSHTATPPDLTPPDSSLAPDAQSLTPLSLPASPLRPKAETLITTATAYPTFNSRQLDEKLALYQNYLAEHGAPDVLVVGSSRALRGVDPIALQNALAAQGYPGATIFNFGVNGATAQVVDIIVRQFLPQDKLPKLILWADGARAFNSGRADVTYNGLVASDGYKIFAAGKPPIPGATVAQGADAAKTSASAQATASSDGSPRSLSGGYQTVNQELNKRLGALSIAYSQRDHLKTSLRDNLFNLLPRDASLVALSHALSAWNPLRQMASNDLSDATSPSAAAANAQPSILSEGQSMIDVDGFLPLSNRFNPATYYQKYARVSGDYDSDYESFDLDGKQTQALMSLIQFSQAHQIPLVFVNLPLTHDYLDPTRKRHEEEFQQHMLRISPQIGLIYRDLNQSLMNQPDYFSDPSHLNRYGAYEVSRRLAVDAMIPWNRTQK